MATRKVAGTERPYTFREFMNKIVAMAQQAHVDYMDHLDYVLGDYEEEKVMDRDYCDVVVRVAYGSCEGIYADFYVRADGNEKHLGTAKTLCEGEEDFVEMSTMGARLCVLANRYMRSHRDEFNWTGYQVYTQKESENMELRWSYYDRDYCEQEARKLHPILRVFIRDNATRVIKEVKRKAA